MRMVGVRPREKARVFSHVWNAKENTMFPSQLLNVVWRVRVCVCVCPAAEEERVKRFVISQSSWHPRIHHSPAFHYI